MKTKKTLFTRGRLKKHYLLGEENANIGEEKFAVIFSAKKMLASFSR